MITSYHRRKKKSSKGKYLFYFCVLLLIAAGIPVAWRHFKPAADEPAMAVVDDQPLKSQTLRRAIPRGEQAGNKRVGVLLPLTGPFARDGKMMLQGIKLAWKELNEQGLEAELVVPSLEEGTTAVEDVAEEMANDPSTIAVVAHLPASQLNTIADILEKHQIPLVIPANPHQSLFGHEWVIPLTPSDRSLAEDAAGVALQWANGKPVVVIYNPAPYGQLLLEGFQSRAASEGFQFRAFEWPDDLDQTEKTGITGRIAASDPGIIWLAGNPVWGAEVMSQLATEPLKCRYLVPPVYDSPFIEELMSQFLERMLFLRPVVTREDGNQDMQQFHEHFQQFSLREPNWLAALGFEAASWIGEALLNPSATRQDVRDRFLRHKGLDSAHEGIAGPVYFEDGGSVYRVPRVAQYKNGRFQVALPPAKGGG